MTLAGYFLGQITWVKENNEKVVLGIVFLSVLPMLISFLKSKLSSKNA
jgi:membrane-associated protein